jgi:hypothetical protein
MEPMACDGFADSAGETLQLEEQRQTRNSRHGYGRKFDIPKWRLAQINVLSSIYLE